MPQTDPRVDKYIARSAPFARPVLEHLRALVHSACPEVEETIKWSSPSFMYKGMLCGMAAFKAHCAFGFWKHELVVPEPRTKSAAAAHEKSGMGSFGKITSVEDLPSPKAITLLIKKAMKLNDEGVKKPVAPRPTKPRRLVIPKWFAAALKANPESLATFEAFSYSHRKEYLEWLTEAKTQETRTRRLETTIQWLSEGKARNWKYAKC
ncbi:MAG: YdeI/OmpD-associated family protein [Planctomycetes bacterium]|nr:YdeI/OmpD-associated family protein [Planctomycetota bacterium]